MLSIAGTLAGASDKNDIFLTSVKKNLSVISIFRVHSVLWRWSSQPYLFSKGKKWDSCYISERASRSLIIYYTINFRLVRHNVLTKKEKSWKYLNFCNCEIVTVLCLDMKLSCTLNDLELHESEMSGEKVFISSYWWSIFQNISFCQHFPFNCK